MSYEQSPHQQRRLDPTQVCAAVRRLGSDLNLKNDNYYDVRSSMESFIETEFSIARPADYIAQLESEGIMPSASMFECYAADPEQAQRRLTTAVDMGRRALYDYWLPMYRETHATAEYRVWVPRLLEVAAGQASGHSRTTCIEDRRRPPIETITLGDGESCTFMSPSCAVSDLCPVRDVHQSLTYGLGFVDAILPEELDMYDTKQLKLDFGCLAEAAEANGILNPVEMEQARERCRVKLG